ncbi:MAG: hypothetical protein KBG30_12090 [Bacteroidales bacterium]|nr:hypothetical protein [Bacteroidales bacterium]
MFFLILAIVISSSRLSVNAEEPIDEPEDETIEDIINDNSPLTDEQILWVKQYLSQYVDENVIEVIITVLSALSIIVLVTIYLVKLVKSVNGGLKLKTQETSTFNEIASNGVQELTNAVLALKNSLKEQLEVNASVIKQNALQNEKLNILESKYNELKEKEAQRLEKAIKLTDELTNKIIKNEV